MDKVQCEDDFIQNVVEIFRRRVATQVGSNLEAVDDFLQFLHEWGVVLRSREHMEKELWNNGNA